MSRDYERTSVYYQQMLAAIEVLGGVGAGCFNQHQLAEQMGRKITASMRKALDVAEANGLIYKFGYLTDKGGRAVGYQVLNVNVPQETNERAF